MNRAILKHPRKHLLMIVASLLMASCAKENAYVPPPPLPVDVQAPLVQDLTVYVEFSGGTEPYNRYEVRTRVTGFIEEKLYKDGSYVKEGDPLFGIEDVMFKAAVAKAEGDLAKAEADLELALP